MTNRTIPVNHDVSRLPLVLRAAILRMFSTSPEAEEQLMRSAGLRLLESDQDESSLLAKWDSTSRGLAASVTIHQEATNDEIACAYFTGPDRATLAARLVPALRYLPTELLHLMARASPVREEREAGLDALSLVYRAFEGTTCWDTDIAATLEMATRDADFRIRLSAAIAGAHNAPTKLAQERIGRLLAGNPEPRLRAALEKLAMSVRDRRPNEDPAKANPGILRLAEGPLPLPIHRIGTVQELTQMYSEAMEVLSSSTASAGELSLFETLSMRAYEFKATMTAAVPASLNVACVCFSGEERVVVAVGSGHALRYYPLHLVKYAAVHGRDPDTRATALWALILATSRRMFPGAPIDPQVAEVLRHAKTDDDSVRFVALSGAALLRDELPNTAENGQGLIDG